MYWCNSCKEYVQGEFGIEAFNNDHPSCELCSGRLIELDCQLEAVEFSMTTN